MGNAWKARTSKILMWRAIPLLIAAGSPLFALLPFAQAMGMLGLLSLSQVVACRRSTARLDSMLGAVVEESGRQQQTRKMEALALLAGGIAHDFNNLLGGILGYASLLRRKLAADEAVATQLRTIEISAHRGTELTARLLGFTRKGGLAKRIVDLNALVREKEGQLRTVLPESIRIDLELADPLWPIEADPAQLGQALTNLCLNARDAMIEGGGTLVLSTENLASAPASGQIHPGLRAGPCVVLRAKDSGHGIPAELQDRIFEPFFTTRNAGGGGRGLGLSTVYNIVKNHGGAVTVDSRPGEGADLRIYLPATAPGSAREPMDALDAPEGAADPEREWKPDLGSVTILIVDDDPVMRSLASDVLAPTGATLLTAADGIEAVDRIRAEPAISLVILDVLIPRMDGVATYREARRLRPSLPVLLCSGYSESSQVSEILLDPGVEMIAKPYTPGQLLRGVRKLLAPRAGGIT